MNRFDQLLTNAFDEIAEQAIASPSALADFRARAEQQDPHQEVVVMLTPVNTPSRRPRWLVPAALGLAAAGLLVLGGAIILRSGTDEVTILDDAEADVPTGTTPEQPDAEAEVPPVTTLEQAPAATTDNPTASAPATVAVAGAGDPASGDLDFDVAVEWTLEATFDGLLLEDPVVFSGGIAALRKTIDADGYSFMDGELWISADGVDWGPAPDQPPGSNHLVGHGDDLFALQDSLFADGGGLWVLGSEGWREVMVDEGIEGAAIGPERIVVFHDGAIPDPFELLGVFDTDTLEPVEFSGLPDLGVEGVLYEGRVAAVGDGFLAYVSWIVDGQTSVRRTLYSADGSMWVEHPTATSDDVDVWDTSWWPGPATYEGVNLVAGPGGGLLVTDDGLEFDAVPSPVRYGSPVTATEAGFFVVTGSGPELFHSSDGSEWLRLETPPTWSTGEAGEEGFMYGTVLTIDDDLFALTIRGIPKGWGGIDDPVTEIWRADASDL